ncbi:MAG: hypothetical protein M3P32_01205 [Chloroflexota bacterium]|nr:hypothetical protein [Chloroflexota bacterium]
MSAWAWLLAAGLAGAASFLAGWPTWRASRARRSRDLNTERYLAWRGRAERPVETGLTRWERQRLVAAGLLALVALFCLVGLFTYL